MKNFLVVMVLFVLTPSIVWGHGYHAKNSFEVIDVSNIDVSGALNCDQSTVSCQIKLESTRILVQALLVQVLEAQLLTPVNSGEDQSEEALDEDLELEDYQDSEYIAALQEMPLRERGVKTFRIAKAKVQGIEEAHPVYQEIARMFTSVIPERYLDDFKKITFSRDEDKYYAAQVYQETISRNGRDSEKWEIQINLADVKLNNDREYNQSIETIAHEVGHVLSLNSDQLDFFVDEEDCERVYLFDMESCTKEGAYYERFDSYWTDHRDWFDEFEEVFEEDREEAEDLLNDYYRENKQEFVSEYAATSHHEDLAESIAFFATSPMPTGQLNRAEDKISTFYEFDEMIEFRKQVQSLLRK